jgi:hypothetical protein
MKVPIRKVGNGAICLRVLPRPSLVCNGRGATESEIRQWPNPSIERRPRASCAASWSPLMSNVRPHGNHLS